MNCFLFLSLSLRIRLLIILNTTSGPFRLLSYCLPCLCLSTLFCSILCYRKMAFLSPFPLLPFLSFFLSVYFMISVFTWPEWRIYRAPITITTSCRLKLKQKNSIHFPPSPILSHPFSFIVHFHSCFHHTRADYIDDNKALKTSSHILYNHSANGHQ